MGPAQERCTVSGDFKVEEFYQNGERVIYVDNKLFRGTYEDAVERMRLQPPAMKRSKSDERA